MKKIDENFTRLADGKNDFPFDEHKMISCNAPHKVMFVNRYRRDLNVRPSRTVEFLVPM